MPVLVSSGLPLLAATSAASAEAGPPAEERGLASRLGRLFVENSQRLSACVHDEPLATTILLSSAGRFAARRFPGTLASVPSRLLFGSGSTIYELTLPHQEVDLFSLVQVLGLQFALVAFLRRLFGYVDEVSGIGGAPPSGLGPDSDDDDDDDLTDDDSGTSVSTSANDLSSDFSDYSNEYSTEYVQSDSGFVSDRPPDYFELPPNYDDLLPTYEEAVGAR